MSELLATPFYRIREKDLQYDIDLLKGALEDNWGNWIAGYSVKTNSLPWLLCFLKKQDFFAEVVSETEYDLAIRLGYTPDHIIYNGPIKNRGVFEAVLTHGGYVNLDSSQELNWLREMAKQRNASDMQVPPLCIGLRVNCDIRTLCPQEQLVEEEGGRFGYCYENGVLGQVIDELRSLHGIKIAGLHLHSSTQSRTVSVYGALARMAVTIAREYGLDLDYVDMGGGYFGGRSDKPDYRDYFKEICKELRSFFDPQKVKLLVEPGVSLISRATTFETSVLDSKDIRGRRFLVTDGSRVNLNPLVTRHFYPHHVVYQGEQERTRINSQWVCGATCMEYDRLFEIENDRVLLPGDRIIYDTAGGYTMCLNPLFIHYFPAVYIEHTDGSYFTARTPWTNDEYLQNQFVEEDK